MARYVAAAASLALILGFATPGQISAQRLRVRDGQSLSLNMVYLDDHGLHSAVEPYIRDELAAVGVEVVSRPLEKEAYNEAVSSGDFHLAFSETWGPPYDPHGFVAGFRLPQEAEYAAQQGMLPPMTKPQLDADITRVLTTINATQRQQGWTRILTALHDQAIFLPLTSLRNMAVINRRLAGFAFGQQQFDMGRVMAGLVVLSGMENVTVAPAAQTGLFKDVGCMNPHSYRPNEFFAVDLVYEGLVSYGPFGVVEPALAESWSITQLPDGRQRVVFMLRRGVTFHDGTPWDAEAAVANFDQVLDPALVAAYHDWYELPKVIESWQADGTHNFTITLKQSYYPLLQELAYIRPLRMVSPAALSGLTGNQRSCDSGDGTITSGPHTAVCSGISSVAGTGPFKFEAKVTDRSTYGSQDARMLCSLAEGEQVQSVRFTRNDGYWGVPPGIPAMVVVAYASTDEVRDALLNNTLDLAYGSGPLSPDDFHELQDQPPSHLTTHLSGPLNTRALVINSGKAPTSSPALRKAIVHAVNKPKIIASELNGLESDAATLFPRNLPYTDVDLVPALDYDPEKTALLLDYAGWQYSSTNEITDLASFLDSSSADGQGSGTSYANATEVPESEKQALLGFKAAIQEDPFGVLTTWDAMTSPCSPPGWTGLTCRCNESICHIVGLDLGSAQLRGTLSPAIGDLAELEVLWVNANQLTGTLPGTALGRLTMLQSLATRGNQFTGPIPSELGSLPDLVTILMQMNRHDGAIPGELGKLTKLETLNLGFNMLTGSIPAGLAGAASLTTISVIHNRLTGSFPLQLAGLGQLQSVDVRGNNLDAVTDVAQVQQLANITIYGLQGVTAAPVNQDGLDVSDVVPDAERNALLAIKEGVEEDLYGFLSSWDAGSQPCGASPWVGVGCACTADVCHVTAIDLGSANLKGTLSPRVGDLSELTVLWVNGNRFSGPLPAQIGNLSLLTGLATRGNFFSDPIPSTITQLSELEYILAQYNRHNGSLPDGIGQLAKLVTLNVGFNQLSGPLPGQALGMLTNLETLVLSHNQLTGKIPFQLAVMTRAKLSTLDLRGNQGLITDTREYTREELQELLHVPHLLVSPSASNSPALSASDPGAPSESSKVDGSTPKWVIPIIVVGSVALLALAGFTSWMVWRARRGRPVFVPLIEEYSTGHMGMKV